MKNKNEFSTQPGYTEWGKQGSAWTARGDLFLDEPLSDSEREDRPDVKVKLSRAMGEKALNPWQIPGYVPGGAGPRSVAEVVDLVQSSQNAGAHDREVLEAREEIGRFEQGGKSG